ncbi:MAG: hypothetical protein Tsb005_09020 [Gammaproteobacteria bacterium]
MSEKIDYQTQAQQLIRLSQEMLSKAKAEEWEAVGEMELTRRHLLEQFYQGTHTPAKLAIMVSTTQALLDIEQQLISQGETSRQQFHGQLNRLLNNKKATNAYKSNQSNL